MANTVTIGSGKTSRPDGRTVLIVDDDSEMRAMLRDFFKSDGLVVREAREAGEAIATLELMLPALIVLDRRMPGTDGLDLLAYARTRHPSVPIILVTAFGGPAVAAEAAQRGAARYIEKPFRIGVLLEAVSEILRARPAGGEHPH